MRSNLYTLLASFSVVLLYGCVTGRVIDYQDEIYPLLEDHCHQCHTPPDGEGFLESGLNMESYESLMEGSYYGEVIIPGDSRRSVLNKLVEGRAGQTMLMPHDDKNTLTDEEIEMLRLWVDQGAKE